MHQPLVPHRIVLALVTAALVLPIIICVVIAVAGLLGAMGDSAGGLALHRVAVVGGLLWAIDLICLVILLAIGTFRGPDEPSEPE
jgi:hypothetical protein